MDDESTLLPLGGGHDHDFDVVLRGYDRRQVDEHVRFLEDALHRAEESAARTTPDWTALGERVAQILTLAEQEAEDIRAAAAREVSGAERQAEAIEAAAQARADRLVEQAQQEADRLVADARAEGERQRDVVTEEIAQLAARRDDIRAQLEQLRQRLAAAMGDPGTDDEPDTGHA